jgi:hypothetical protein
VASPTAKSEFSGCQPPIRRLPQDCPRRTLPIVLRLPPSAWLRSRPPAARR